MTGPNSTTLMGGGAKVAWRLEDGGRDWRVPVQPACS